MMLREAIRRHVRRGRERRFRREELRFSPIFYERFRARTVVGQRREFFALYFTVGLFALTSLPLAFGCDTVIAACVTGGIALFVLWASYMARLARCPGNVLPFFERRLGEIDTFLAGTVLLWNSRALDEIASSRGATPLSAFASGDPVLHGEPQTLFEPTDALATTEVLLRAPETALLGEEVVRDLGKLRHALALATRHQVKFCLHLRTTDVASGHEMDLRNGSYF